MENGPFDLTKSTISFIIHSMKMRTPKYIKYSNKVYDYIFKPFDKLLFPVVEKDALIKERQEQPVPLNKTPNVADIYNEEWGGVLRSIKSIFGMDQNSFHRKIWEFTHILYILKTLGYLHPDNTGLTIGAGREQILYFLAYKIRKIVGIDLYEGNYIGGEDESDIPVNPEKYAPFIYPGENLDLLKMDALDLKFEPESFDFVFSASSIEHFGSENNIRKSIDEMYRVLKPGGLCVITTELKLNRLAKDIPNTKLFSMDELLGLFRDSGFILEGDDVDVKLEDHYLINWVKLPQEVFKSPHVILRFFRSIFTSVALVFRKEGDAVQTGPWKETEQIVPLTYTSDMEVRLEKNQISPGGVLPMSIRLENRSNFDWFVNGVSHRIAIGIKLMNSNEAVIDEGFGEIVIPENIKRGENLTFETTFSTKKLAPGKYKLFVGLKRELMTWFFEKGEAPSILDFEVL